MRALQRWLLGMMVTTAALVAVGLSAPADGPFSIAVHPVFWRVDAVAIAEARASALGVDVDVKLGSMHVHVGWSALPLS